MHKRKSIFHWHDHKQSAENQNWIKYVYIFSQNPLNRLINKQTTKQKQNKLNVQQCAKQKSDENFFEYYVLQQQRV